MSFSDKSPLISGSTKYLESNGKSSEDKKAEGFGEKTIGFFGGFALILNNISGPGMVLLAPLFQQAGWLTPLLALVIVCTISGFSSTMMVEAMSRIPGNEKFQGRVEISSLAKFYFGRIGYFVTIILFILSLQSQNIAAIIESAQTMDDTILAIFKSTCGVEFFPHPGGLCVHSAGTDESPFGNIYVLSVGFLVVMILVLPMGYYNLDDNIIVQKFAFGLFMLIIVQWVAFFLYLGIDVTSVPMIGPNQSQVLGTIIFNYAYVISIPSWVNEKKEGVSINKSIWGAAIYGTFLFAFMGFFGAWTFHFTDDSQDLLDVINASAQGPTMWLKVMARITVYAFPIITQLSSIPIYSIMIRYNLIENKICNKIWANFWAVLFPWVVAVPFYTGSGLALVISWTSLFVNGFINFVIPLSLYVLSHHNRYLQHRPHMLVRTYGEHHTNILSAEVSTISINSSPETKTFVALPHKLKPSWLAIGMSVVITLGVIASIVINFLSL